MKYMQTQQDKPDV